jgi:hypothetical protein
MLYAFIFYTIGIILTVVYIARFYPDDTDNAPFAIMWPVLLIIEVCMKVSIFLIYCAELIKRKE